jgi:hypothetical protein
MPPNLESRTEYHVDANQYTRAQVLCGLREVWPVLTGTDDIFDADTQVYTFMMADGSWDDLDLADVCHGLERFFGFTCSRGEWMEFFGFDVAERSPAEWEQCVVPKMTFGSLAQFIALRAPVVESFEPKPVFGRNCATAGVFAGIQQVADHINGDCPRFAPSSRVIDVMRGNELDKFWTQLRWITERSIPALPAVWRDVTCFAGCFAVIVVFGGLIATWRTSNPVWAASSLFGGIAIYLTAWLYKRFSNPLPSHIESFRDLSKLIVESRQGF